MLEQALMLTIANHLRDIHNQLNSTILEAKSHRPTWKITRIKTLERDPLTGQDVEKEIEIVDKLSPLTSLFMTLEKSALNGQSDLQVRDIPS